MSGKLTTMPASLYAGPFSLLHIWFNTYSRFRTAVGILGKIPNAFVGIFGIETWIDVCKFHNVRTINPAPTNSIELERDFHHNQGSARPRCAAFRTGTAYTLLQSLACILLRIAMQAQASDHAR